MSDALRADATGQLRDAIEPGTPFVLPIGVMEYHGGHLPVGVDMLAVTEVLARLEPEVVLLPPFAYGAASHAVAGPEGTGNLHVDATALVPFAEGAVHGAAAGRLAEHPRRHPPPDRELRAGDAH